MKINKIVSNQGNDCEIRSEEGDILGSVNKDTWATNFFNRKWGNLHLKNESLLKLKSKNIENILDELGNFADENNYNLLEYQCNVSDFSLIPTIEEMGFRLVDSKILFLTKIEKPLSHRYLPKIGGIIVPDDNDLESILDLTNLSFTNNPGFKSRFKNRKYFSHEDTKRYYTTWVKNNFKNENTLFAVIKHKNKVISQLSLRPSGFEQEIRLYRAMFPAVRPEFRGHKTHLALTSFLYDQVKENIFFLDSTTQLTNFSILKNNIRAQRSLKSITLIFYRT